VQQQDVAVLWFTLRAETLARERLLAGLRRDLAALPG
jgi:hypothetical protein